MTLEEILAAVVAHTNRSDKELVARTGITFALSRITARHQFKDLVKEVDIEASAGVSFIDFPADYLAFHKALWITDATSTQSWTITVRSKNNMTNRVPNPSSVNASYPYEGYIEGRRLYFVPATANGGFIRLTYSSKPTLVELTDMINVNGIDEVILYYAVAHVFQSVGLYQEAQANRNLAAQALEDAVSTDIQDNIHNQAEMTKTEGTYIEPHLDPFAGHNKNWYG